MFKKLKEKKGGGSVFPIMIFLIVLTLSVSIIYLMNLDNEVRAMQKNRYTKAVDMAVSTAMANIDLSESTTDLNSTLSTQQQQMGVSYETTSTDLIAAGYETHKRIMVNKETLMDTFYEVLLRNFQLKGLSNIQNFQRYIPLKAILQYDTISVSAADMALVTRTRPDGTTYEKYVDVWQDTRLSFKEGTTDIYMTLGDKCYTLIDPSIADITNRYKESNRKYFSISGPPDPNNPSPSTINEQRKNRELAKLVQNVLNAYANSQKSNLKLKYQMQIADFDYTIRRPDTTLKIQSSVNAAKDVTFYCLVEGLPVKSLLKGDEPNNSFYTFSTGGASLKRADE